MSETANASDAQPVAGQSTGAMDILQIQAILPHRYPFLLIDRVVEMEPRKRIVALKNVTINEPFFAGHFPGSPIMPGVLQVEAMAQAGAVLLLTEIGGSSRSSPKPCEIRRTTRSAASAPASGSTRANSSPP